MAMGKVNLIGDQNLEELVITPGGLRPKSKVHLIENGFSISLKDNILRKIDVITNNVVKEFGKINQEKPKHLVNRNILRKPVKKTIKKLPKLQIVAPITDKWIVYSGWKNENNNPISYFSTNWTVPPPPSTDNGQLIYLFNGIENSASNIILQPVLQWGNSPAGGGSFWAIASWFVGSPLSGLALHSPLVPVSPGTSLQGIMILNRQLGNQFSYLSSFNGVPSCDLLVTDIEELTWANETLECYRLKQFSDYPNISYTSMSNVEIKLGNAQASIMWQAYNDVTDNGQHCSIKSNASPGGCVSIFYK